MKKILALLVFALTLLVPSAVAQTTYEPVVYPAQQTAVGTASLSESNGTYTFSNSLFTATFEKTGNVLQFGGCDAMYLKGGTDLFSVTFGDNTTVKSSQMTLKENGVTYGNLTPKENAVKGSDHYNGKYLQAEYTYTKGDATLTFIWRAELRDGSHYLRTDLTTRSSATIAMKNLIPMLYLYDVAKGGSAPIQLGNTSHGKVLMNDKIFAGLETPMGKNTVEGSNTSDKYIQGLWSRNASLIAYDPDDIQKDMVWNVSTVIGVLNPAHKRRSFLAYSERERAVPWRAFPMYNSWYELNIGHNNGADPSKNSNANDCANVVQQWKTNLYDKYNVGIKSFVWDDGWDKYGTWDFHEGYPNALKEPGVIANQMNTSMGVWLGPEGGYDTSSSYRRKYWTDKGETMVLGNRAYYDVFKGACEKLIKTYPEQYGYKFNYFKFDGISQANPATGPVVEENAEGIITAERYVRENLMEDVFFNTTVGTWASPFWYHFTDATWRQGQDWGKVGNNSNDREAWITYRDHYVYDYYIKPYLNQNAEVICPINTLMTHGVIITKNGSVSKNMAYKNALNELRCGFACGSGQVELYCDYALLNSINDGKLWQDIAECIKWQKDNAQILPDAHWVGGNPWDNSKENIYGWAAWSGTLGKCTFTLRNGNASEQTYTTTLREALDIPSNVSNSLYLVGSFKDLKLSLSKIAKINGQAVQDNSAISLDDEITFTLPGSSVYVYDGSIAPFNEPAYVDVSYTFKHGDEVWATESLVAEVGEAYPAPATTKPYGVNYEAPTGNVTAGGNVDIAVTLADDYPFSYSTQEIPQWYTLKIRTSKNVGYNATNNNFPNADNQTAAHFAFIGNPWSFKIICYEAEGKALGGTVGNNNKLSAVAFANGADYCFENNKDGNNVSHYVFRPVGGGAYINDVTNLLGYWADGQAATDGGSTFAFQVASSEDLDPIEPAKGDWTDSDWIACSTSQTTNFYSGAYLDKTVTVGSAASTRRQVRAKAAEQGTNTVIVTVTYERGSHAQPIYGVQLLDADGNEVAHNYTYNTVGNNPKTWTCTFNNIAEGTYTARVWSAATNKEEDQTMTAEGTVSTQVNSEAATSQNWAKESWNIDNTLLPEDLKTNELKKIGTGNLNEDANRGINRTYYYLDKQMTFDKATTLTTTITNEDNTTDLDLIGVELLQNGTLVTTEGTYDGHYSDGETNNTYTVQVPSAGDYTVRTWASYVPAKVPANGGANYAAEESAPATETVLARMTDLVGGGTNHDGVVSTEWSTDVEKGAVYDFTASNSYVGAINNSAIATALNDGTNYITVAAWVYGNGTTSQSNIFGYGGGAKGVKFNINGSTLKTTTKNVKDFPNQAASLQENQWNLIAYTIPEKSNTSATQYAYYAGTSTGTRYLKDGYSSSSGWAYNVPATQQFSIASANCDGASECYSGLIANLTVIESNDFMTYEKLYSLVGPAPTASATPDPYDGKTFIIRHANPAQATKHLAIADNGENVEFSTRTDGLEAWTFEATGTPGQYKLNNPNFGYLKNTAYGAECLLDYSLTGEDAAIIAVADYTPTSGQATAGLTGVVTLTNTATNKQLFNNAEANTKAYFGYGASTASNSWGCQFIIEEYVAPSELLPTFEAQAPNAITSGWYQIKWDDTDSDSKTGVVSSPNGKFVKNYDTDITVSDKAYPLYLDTENGVPATADESAKTYVYVDRANANVGTVASIRSANGHYVSIDGSASIAEAKNLYLIFRSQGSKPKGTVVSSGTGGNRNSWLPIEENGDKYIGQGSQDKFPVAEFSPVDLATIGLTEYTVNVEGTTSPVQVSYSGSDNKGLDKVYDNGTFFFTTGATPTTEQFSAPQVSGSDATITVDGTNHTITVTYSIVDDITEQITYDQLNGNTWTKWAESAWAGSVPTDITALDNTNYTEANLRVISKKYEFEAGENLQATFQYVAEGHTQRTDIVGVDIVDADGNVVLSDYHNGYTGSGHSLNVYTLNNIPAGIYTVRYITSARSSDGANINTGGTITNVITVGQMPVGGHVYTIYNDHSDVAYYLQNNTEGYTQISTDAAEGDANKWIVWGDNTTGIQIYNLANKHLFTTKDGTLLDIKNVNAQVGVTIYNHGTNTTQAGNKASGALRVNDHYTNGNKANEDRTYSTDFVFIPTGQFAYHVESYGELTGLTVNIKGESHNIGDFYITDTELTEDDLESVGENTKVVLDGFAIRLDKKCTFKVSITENEKGATAVLYNGESKSDEDTFVAFVSEVNAENFETAYDYLSQTTAITPNTTDDAVDYDVTTTYTVLYHPTWRTDGPEGREGVTHPLKADGTTKYMIFDTATQGTDDWAGFMYPKGNKVGKTSPCTPLEYKGPEMMLWTVEKADVETGDGYYLRNVATGKYYDGYGDPHDEKVVIYIQMFPEATMTTADSTAHSVNRYEEPIVDIKDDKGCWAIGASREAMTVVGGGPCWNGPKAGFTAWWCSSPFAFYEICELEEDLLNCEDIKDVLIDYCQYFEGMNDNSHDYRTYQEKVDDAETLNLNGSFTDYVNVLREEKEMKVKYPQPVEIDGQKYGRFITVRNAVNLDYLKGNSVSMDRAVMWLNADNELVSYDTGLGYSGTDAATAIAGGKNFSVLTLSEVSPKRGTLVVKTSDNKYLASSGDREHGTSYTSKTEATATNATTWYVDNADYVVATIPASGYTTFYAPVPMEVPEDVKVYGIKPTEYKENGLNKCDLVLTELPMIPAGTAVVLQGNPGTTRVNVSYDVKYDEVKGDFVRDESTYWIDADAEENNVLKGYDYTCTNLQTSSSDGVGGKYIYTLSNGKFQYYTGSTIKAFKCFLELTQDYRAGHNAATNPFRIIINDETTGISGAKTSSDNNAFDLSGRRINVQSERGLYILNGKKVIR